MTQCKLCNHPDRDEIERALLTHAISGRDAAQRVGCSPPSITRHQRNHVSKLVKRETIRERAFNVLGALEQSHDDCRKLFDTAVRNKQPRVALLALQTELRQLEVIAKTVGAYSDAPQLTLMIDARFGQIKEILFSKLADHPQLRLEIATALEGLVSETTNQVIDQVDEANVIDEVIDEPE